MASNSSGVRVEHWGSVAPQRCQVYTTLQRLELRRLGAVRRHRRGRRQKNYRHHRKGCEESLDGSHAADLFGTSEGRTGDSRCSSRRVWRTSTCTRSSNSRRYIVQLMQQWTRLKKMNLTSTCLFALAVDAELFRLDAVVALARQAPTVDFIERPLSQTPEKRFALPSIRRRDWNPPIACWNYEACQRIRTGRQPKLTPSPDIDLAVERGSLRRIMGPRDRVNQAPHHRGKSGRNDDRRGP